MGRHPGDHQFANHLHGTVIVSQEQPPFLLTKTKIPHKFILRKQNFLKRMELSKIPKLIVRMNYESNVAKMFFPVLLFWYLSHCRISTAILSSWPENFPTLPVENNNTFCSIREFRILWLGTIAYMQTYHQISSLWWTCQLFIPSSRRLLLYFTFLILPYPLWFPHPTICLCVNTTASISLLKNHPSNCRWGLNRCLLWQLMVIVTLPMVCHISSTQVQKRGSQSVRYLSKERVKLLMRGLTYCKAFYIPHSM